MLQGNPFETELVVRERTAAVRNGVDQRLPLTKDPRKVRDWWRRIVAALRPPSEMPRRLQPVEDQS